MGKGDAVVIDNGAGLIVMDSALDAVCKVLSATCTVKFAVPATVGGPLITPAGESDRPVGKDPPASDHVYGVAPPTPDSVCEYCTLVVPSGSDAVVTVSFVGLIVMDSALDAVCEVSSVT